MEEFLPQDWQLSSQQRKLLKYGSIGAAGLYFLYRVYRSDSLTAITELRERVLKTLDDSSKSALLASECSNKVLQDLQSFLLSDSDELPQSLRQLAKLASSQEVAEAASALAAAATRGALGCTSQQAVGKDGQDSSMPAKPDLLERILDLATTDRGMNLVQLAVSVASRSAVKAYCEMTPRDSQGPSFWQEFLGFGTTPKGEKLFAACVGSFVREGTKVWMGGLEGVSGWEDFLNNVCKPERQLAVERLTRTFVNELVKTYLRGNRRGRQEEESSSKHSPGTKAPALRCAPSKENVAFAKSAHEGKAMAGREGTAALTCRHEWTTSLAEAVKHPEVRSLMVSVARVATAEGVRTSLLTTRDLVLGVPQQVAYSVVPGPQGPHTVALGEAALYQLSTRSLGTLLLFIFMPIIMFLAGRRAALA